MYKLLSRISIVSSLLLLLTSLTLPLVSNSLCNSLSNSIFHSQMSSMRFHNSFLKIPIQSQQAITAYFAPTRLYNTRLYNTREKEQDKQQHNEQGQEKGRIMREGTELEDTCGYSNPATIAKVSKAYVKGRGNLTFSGHTSLTHTSLTSLPN